MNDNIIDDIWQQFDSVKEQEVTVKENTDLKCCINCKSKLSYQQDSETICTNCGSVLNKYNYVHSYQDAIPFRHTSSSKFSNIQRLQQWTMYTNEEKSQYKLKKYTETICEKLGIENHLIPIIANTVCNVMDIIKENEGTKRARVKDGIILSCIHYLSKYLDEKYDSVSLAKKLDLNIKYITKADKIILPLIHNGKLKLDKRSFLQTETPFFYVNQMIDKYNLNVPPVIITQVHRLINLCEEHDLLLDHTPQSVGICCFYYILKLNNIQIDVKIFIEIYNISAVTLFKTHSKLQNYQQLFKKHNIVAIQ
jgi:transcription initiation factor TFIIIB Brf1 subunit/transcription initiation factor TFIIB